MGNIHTGPVKLILAAGIIVLFSQHQAFTQESIDAVNPPKIVEFLADQPMTRAGRPFVLLATISNTAKGPVELNASLIVPEGIHIEGDVSRKIKLKPDDKISIRWTIIGEKPLYKEVILVVSNKGDVLAARRLPLRFLPELEITEADYIPEPVPIRKNSEILVGVHNFPAWEHDAYDRWSQLKKHPERTPALGFYAQENPEVADWETKWAAEHGVDYYIYCWYRLEQGRPIKQRFPSTYKALFNSRFQDRIKFTIMWVNHNVNRPEVTGVSDEADLMDNLFPFWMENYFKRSNYLLVDNKPVLFIYRPQFLIEELGSIENVRRAFDKMREASRREGFDGLWLLGEFRYLRPEDLQIMKDIGLDYTFAYCWHVQNSPSPQQAIDAQIHNIETTQELNIIPQVVTVSQGWSGWKDEGSIWTIPPTEFETLLRQARGFVETLPEDQLSGRMLILDNWNEWGEGHYLLPYTEYGFGYLDAIRRVFSDSPDNHIDLIPEDIGMGPYETSYREWLARQRGEK